MAAVPARLGLATLLLIVLPTPGLAEERPASASDEAAARKLVRRADENRPDDQLRVKLFGRPLVIGGELQSRTDARWNPRLDAGAGDFVTLRHKAELELTYLPAEGITVFLEGKAFWNVLRASDGDDRSSGDLERGEMWVHFARIAGTPAALQIGRQNFKDAREWWWDADLDAARLAWDAEHLQLELAVAQQIAGLRVNDERIAPEQDDVLYLLGRGSWEWRPRHRFELFFAHSNDHSGSSQPGTRVSAGLRDESDAQLTWLGARARGRIKLGRPGRLHYWLDLGWVTGSETLLDFDRLDGRDDLRVVGERLESDVRGWAADLGVTWQRRRGGPSLTLGWAYGSGDPDPSSGADRSFRQTGLQDNNGRFRGVDRFRYYGELLDPELSNLHVFTLSVGIPLLTSSSVEIVYHYYRQDRPAPFLRDAKLGVNPGGVHADLGQELDLVIGIEEWKHWELELVGSVFRSGAAFEDRAGDFAGLGMLKLKYNF